MKPVTLLALLFALFIASCAAIDLPDSNPEKSTPQTVSLHERIQAAEAYDNHGLAAQAEQEYKAALLMAPGDIKVLTNLIRISSALHHYEDAETYCRRALEVEPGKADVLNYLAWLSVKTRNDYVAAHKWIDGAIAANSEQKPFYMESKGLIYMDQKHYEEAVNVFRAALETISGSQLTGKPRAVLEIDIYKNMGRAFRSLGREQEAKDSLRKALAIASATNLPLTPE